jgi:hypothetical protein
VSRSVVSNQSTSSVHHSEGTNQLMASENKKIIKFRLLLPKTSSQVQIENDEVEKGKSACEDVSDMPAKLTSQNTALWKEVIQIKKERQELETKSENELLKLKIVIRNLNEEKEILKEKVSDFEVITLSDKILIDQLQDELAKLRSEKRKNEIGKLTVHNT